MSAESLSITLRAIDEVSAPLRQVQESLQRMQQGSLGVLESGERLSNFGDQFVNNVSRPIVQGLGASTNAAIALESVMSDTNKALGIQPNTQGAAALNAEIMSLSSELGQMPTAIANFYTEAGKLGIVRDQMDDYTRLVNQAGVAWDMTSTQAGEAVSVLSNVMGLFDAQTGMVDLQGLTALGDTINYLADTGATSEAAIAQVLQRSGSTMRMFGLLNEEAAALATGFLNLGYPPEVVGTALNGMLPMLSNATQQTQGFQDALESIGLPAAQFEQMVRQDATGAIMDLMDAATASGDTGIWQRLFGTGSDSAMLAAASQNLDNFRNTLDSIENVQAGGMLQSYENRLQTSAAQMERFRSTIFQLGATIGAAILPAMNGLLNILTPIVAGFAEFAANHPGIVQVSVAIAAVVAAIGPLIIGAGMVVSAIGAIQAAFAVGGIFAAGGMLGGVGAAFGAIAAAALPIVGIVAAIAAAAYLVISNWESVSAFFQGLFARIQSFIAGFMAGLMQGLAPAMPAIQSLMQSFQQIGAAIMQASTAIFGLLQSMMRFGLAIAQLTPLGMLLSQIGAAFQSAGGSATSFGAAVGNAAGLVIGAIAQIAARAMSLVSTFASVASAIISTISGLASQMFSAGQRIVQQIAQGIMAGIGAVRDAASSVANAVRSMLPGSPVKTGPLTVLNNPASSPGAEIVRMIGRGMQAVDLNNYMQPVVNSMASIMPPAIAPQAQLFSQFQPPTGRNQLDSGLSPTVTAGGGTTINVTIGDIFANTAEDAQAIGDSIEERLRELLPELLEQEEHRQMRVSYG